MYREILDRFVMLYVGWEMKSRIDLFNEAPERIREGLKTARGRKELGITNYNIPPIAFFSPSYIHTIIQLGVKTAVLIADTPPVGLCGVTLQCFGIKGVKCFCCGIEGNMYMLHANQELFLYNYNPYHPIPFTRMNTDHIRRRRDGGADTVINLRPSCIICNTRRA